MTTPLAAPAPNLPAPVSQQPYFVPTAVVLGLSVLLFIGFLVKEQLLQSFFDAQFIVAGIGMVASIALFVMSLVLRARTKRAGGRLGLAIAAIVLSSLNLFLIVASLIVIALLFGFVIYLFTGGLF